MWVYIRSEPSLWTVGFYAPDATRLNGGADATRLNGGKYGTEG